MSAANIIEGLLIRIAVRENPEVAVGLAVLSEYERELQIIRSFALAAENFLRSIKIKVHGAKELERDLLLARRELRGEINKALLQVAEAVRADAEERAVTGITHIGDRWGRMRVGHTRSLVYVAPRETGRRSRRNPNLRRPNLAPLMMNTAMQPALDAHAADAVRVVERAVDKAMRDHRL